MSNTHWWEGMMGKNYYRRPFGSCLHEKYAVVTSENVKMFLLPLLARIA